MSKLKINKLPPTLVKLCQHLAEAGGKAWLVGGCVRDLMLGIAPKDFDIEVYGLPSTLLQTALQQLGRCDHVGQQFGVYKLHLGGMAFDVALPRSEKKTGPGHCAFDITPDPFISTHQASLRRDFSINAMMFEPLENTFIDHHAGTTDLECGILRHVSPAFSEDPLRPLRAMQLAARFQLSLHDTTAALCKTLLNEAGTLAKERIWLEWQKWSHAAHPSYGLQALYDSGWLELYPDLQAMLTCPQSPRWHPEGSVWTHTLQVCDQAAIIAKRNQLNDAQTEQLLFAALCHDLAKPSTTYTDPSGDIVSPEHCKVGVAMTKVFLHRIAAPRRLAALIMPMVAEHLCHFHGQATCRAVRRLACRLEPANIEIWEMLTEADASGCAPAAASRPAYNWLQKALQLQHHLKKPQAVLTGETLIQLGISPGPHMGHILHIAYEAQVDGQFSSQTNAILWLKKNDLLQ